MRLIIPVALLLALGATPAFAGPPDVEYGRLNRWLWPQQSPRTPPKIVVPPRRPVEPHSAGILPQHPMQVEQPTPPIVAPRIIAVPERKPRPKAKRVSALPSCAYIRAEYNRMTVFERLAAYHNATDEQVAHGKRCLGMT